MQFSENSENFGKFAFSKRNDNCCFSTMIRSEDVLHTLLFSFNSQCYLYSCWSNSRFKIFRNFPKPALLGISDTLTSASKIVKIVLFAGRWRRCRGRLWRLSRGKEEKGERRKTVDWKKRRISSLLLATGHSLISRGHSTYSFFLQPFQLLGVRM